MEEILNMPDKEYYRPDEVAKYNGVHVSTVRRWIREERIQAIRTLGGHNRIPKSEMIRINNTKNTVKLY